MSDEIKICAVIPLYNHAHALPDVVAGAAEHAPVIVVDDGSTDGGADVLRPGLALAVVRHEQNMGKAEALKSGFSKARELGFTHAVTIDADGQHLGVEIPKFTEACRSNPEALLVGVRDFKKAGAPLLRRLANALSNVWFRFASGARLSDTQCGFRCYPLAHTEQILCRARRYGYELEIMVRAAWLGIKLIPIPVSARYEPRMLQGSHFRPITDFLLIAWLNTKLAAEMFFVPQHLRAMMSDGELQAYPLPKKIKTVFAKVMTDHVETPVKLASAAGLGFFLSVAPIWGFQMATGVLLAHMLKLNKAIVAMLTAVSIPPAVPFICYTGFRIGRALLGEPQWRPGGWSHALKEAGWGTVQWFVGSIMLGIALGAAAWVIAYALALVFMRRRAHKQKVHAH